jgi:hypothetical protein
MSKTSGGFLGHIACGAAVLGAALLFTGQAHAVDFGVGLIGQAGGNFIGKPDRSAGQADVNPGFGGVTIGGGLMLEARLIPLLGIEVDVLRTSDKGKGSVSFNGNKSDVTIGQGAWHVPVLAKLVIPSPLIAPTFVLGPEFVFPSDPHTDVSPSINSAVFSNFNEKYVMITGGVGLEVKLPLPVIDLRIPVGLRVSYNPSAPSSYTDTTKFATNGAAISYSSEWKFAVSLTAGAALYF